MRRCAPIATGQRFLPQALFGQGPAFHISTDYVFDGQSGRPIERTIGRSSQCLWAEQGAGERLVRDTCPQHLILRTSWYSVLMARIRSTTAAAWHRRGELKVVDDQTGCPTSAAACRRDSGGPGQGRQPVSAPGPTLSRRRYPHLARLRPADLRASRVVRVYRATHYADRYASFASKAKRPACSVLSTEKHTNTFGIEPGHSWAPARTPGRLLGQKVRRTQA